MASFEMLQRSLRILICSSTIIIVLCKFLCASDLLNSGQVLVREIAGAEKQVFTLTLFEKQYLPLIVEQNGIDVVVQWFDPAGNLVTEFDHEFRLNGVEKADLVAVTNGSYRLEIEAKYRKDHKGRFKLQVGTPRNGTELETSIYEAAKAYTKSNQFHFNGDFNEAVAPAQQALTLYEKLSPESAEMVRSLYNLAKIWHDKGDYEQAGPLYDRAIALGERTMDPNSPELAQILARFGWLNADEGEIEKAEALYNRALKIDQEILGNDHPEVAWILDRLASLMEDKGDYAGSENLCKQALSALEKSVEPDDPMNAWPLHDLAYVYWRTGDLTKSVHYFQRAFDIREKALGPNHPLVATSAGGLASAYRAIGDLKKSTDFHLKSLEIRKKVYGEDSFRVASGLNNLAIVYEEQNELDKAIIMFERALSIFEKHKSQEMNVSYPLQNLSVIYRKKNDPEKAEAYLRRAIAIREKFLGTDHPEVADLVNNMGNIYHMKGEFDLSLEFQLRALNIWEKSFGQWYPDNVLALNAIAADYMAKGDYSKAVEYQLRAEEFIEHNLTLNLSAGSERQRLGYQEMLENGASQTISLNVNFASEDKVASELAFTAILQRKGRVLDSMMENLTALRHRFAPQDRVLLDRLNETTSQLSELVLNGPQQESLSSHQAHIKTLEEEREKLESEIAERSAGFYQKSKPISIAAVRSTLPPNSALIEFAEYRPFNPTSKKYQAFDEPHYIAYILRSEGNIFWKDLGIKKIIDNNISAMRAVLQDRHRTDVRKVAQTLEQKIMTPLRPFLSDTKLLLLSTDGELSLLPFEAMMDEKGRYLVEQYSVTYLTSGRDLVRLQTKHENKNEPIIVADPVFGEPEISKLANEPKLPAKRRSVTTASDMASVYFARLSGTSQEAQAIKTLFPEANIFTGQRATESSIKKMDAPRILHVATHGFFLTDDATEVNTQDTRSIQANLKIENPLLRSGLALANANLDDGTGDDGILTALEVSGLNLWGTKLAVLSACDTGLGQVRNGEGVYGLRRAFVLAGVESLVMSLWSVSDSVTRELMTNYYQGIKENLGRGEALRQVKLNMLKRKGREHPYYWASFIQLGEWANLEGIR
jgi:CHAT domain-containing protein/Tfp pilus assembly protein PilF